MSNTYFHEVVESGTVVEKSGYHQPDGRRFAMGRHPGCGCDKTTSKGAYRDVIVEKDNGKMIHFYHQTPVVEKEGNRYILNTGGYETKTTKRRINRYLPSGYKLYQKDFTWYLDTPEGTQEFFDKMEVEA